MPTDTVSIAQFIKANGITCTSVPAGANPNMDGSADMDNYRVTMARPQQHVIVNGALDVTGRKLRMTTYFSKGIGHHGAEPTADEVLDCLASDAAGYENSPTFCDWCAEYGYDTDSRKAERTWKAVKHASGRLKRFLGDDLYQQLLWHTERM